MKVGNGNIPIRLGNLINTRVYGGPYRAKPEEMFGVKMAAEIDHPHNVSIPTRDFCVPNTDDVRKGVMQALMAMVNDEVVYAGCMGGIGRTGLFLGVLAKLQSDYRKYKHRPGRGVDPVEYVREHFIPHAIETQEQQDFVRNFDTTDMVEWIDITQRAMGLGGAMTPPKDNTPPESIYEFLLDNDDPLVEQARIVERDLDWIDDVDADSLSEAEDVSLTDQINDVWQYLDEHDDTVEALTGRLAALEMEVTTLKQAQDGILKALRDFSKKVLTNESFFGKVRKLFK